MRQKRNRKEITSTLVWHRAAEESPAESGTYTVVWLNDNVLDYMEYNATLKLWNSSEGDDGKHAVDPSNISLWTKVEKPRGW